MERGKKVEEEENDGLDKVCHSDPIPLPLIRMDFGPFLIKLHDIIDITVIVRRMQP